MISKMPMHRLKFAVVCSSNMNRSMEAHRFMSKKGFDVESFGTGNQVKLPGPAADKPNVYSFDTRYEDIFSELKKKDQNLYTQNGVLSMLDRNRRIKPTPQRFQEYSGQFDIIITVEERVYDQVLEDFNNREQESMQPVHVINIDIQDNHEEATIGAFVICELAKLTLSKSKWTPDLTRKSCSHFFSTRKCSKLSLYRVAGVFDLLHFVWGKTDYEDEVFGLRFPIESTEDVDNDMDELLQEFEEKANRTVMHSVHFY